ncbi:MAG: hypothetical protein ACK4TA_11240 [Saprospiraceae bacterium]
MEILTKEALFWQWFKENEHSYYYYHEMPESEEKDILKVLIAFKLWDYCFPLNFMITEDFYDEEKRHFIVTVDCDEKYFEQVYNLVKYAPRDLPHWVFHALIPPAKAYTEFYDFEYEGIILDSRSIWFRKLVNNVSPLLFGIMIFFKDYDIYHDHEHISGAIRMLLILELGELSFSQNVHHIDIMPLPADPEEHECRPLNELADAIEQHLNQKVNPHRN